MCHGSFRRKGIQLYEWNSISAQNFPYYDSDLQLAAGLYWAIGLPKTQILSKTWGKTWGNFRENFE